ncbi:hypothetical protein LCGC14_0335080 [marine sediment metagenome]|uniref:Uncharacterized protein n=1 Tax=marine sediment metagenome TaxID=412755 RepID=A0A0F9TFJ2_9ZZZZ
MKDGDGPQDLDKLRRQKATLQLAAEEGFTGPQDLNKLIGAGKDLWESDEEFDEWMAMLKEMRRSSGDRDADHVEALDLLREMIANPTAQLVLIHRAQALLDRIGKRKV